MKGKISIKRNSRRVVLTLCFVLYCVFSLLNISQAHSQSSSLYLILYAVEPEGQFLKENMSDEQTQKIMGRSVTIGKMAGIDVILAEAGIGLTNAAMSTQKFIDEFLPTGIIVTGAAGAVDSKLQIGDIVICEKWMTHDAGVFGAKGFQPLPIIAYSPKSSRVIEAPHFSVDSTVFRKMQKMIEEISFEKIGGRIPKLILGGTSVSRNCFIDNQEKRVWLQKNFQALIVDCETAAVAQVCSVNDIPFIAIRSASDLAGGSREESACGKN